MLQIALYWFQKKTHFFYNLLNPLHLTWFPHPLASLQGGHNTQHSLPPPVTPRPLSKQGPRNIPRNEDTDQRLGTRNMGL